MAGSCRRGGARRRGSPWPGTAWAHPIASAGEPADLEADVRGSPVGRQDRPPGSDGTTGSTGSSEVPEERCFARSVRPIKVCLLLRLGRAEPGRGGLGRGDRSSRPAASIPLGAANADLTSNDVSYVTWPTTWPWNFDRARRATPRRRRDRPADARKLTNLQKAVETQANVDGLLPSVRGSSSNSRRPRPISDSSASSPTSWPIRVATGPGLPVPRPPVPPPGADKKARLAALIAELDQIGPSRDGASIVKALVTEGEGAVGPLIEAAEHETRGLTRSLAPPWKGSIRTARDQAGCEFAQHRMREHLFKTSSFGPGRRPRLLGKVPSNPARRARYRTLGRRLAAPPAGMASGRRSDRPL